MQRYDINLHIGINFIKFYAKCVLCVLGIIIFIKFACF